MVGFRIFDVGLLIVWLVWFFRLRDDDDSADEGPPYFGFVKDGNGATMPDTKVTVAVKERGGVVTRSRPLIITAA